MGKSTISMGHGLTWLNPIHSDPARCSSRASATRAPTIGPARLQGRWNSPGSAPSRALAVDTGDMEVEEMIEQQMKNGDFWCVSLDFFKNQTDDWRDQ